MSPFNLPLADRPDLVTYVNGEPRLSRKAMAYLMGITEEDITAEYERQGKPESLKLPMAWVRAGKANAARLGTDNMAEALALLVQERERSTR